MLLLTSLRLTSSSTYDASQGVEICDDGSVCYNHARCYDDDFDGTYSCRCQIGFNGTRCDLGEKYRSARTLNQIYVLSCLYCVGL